MSRPKITQAQLNTFWDVHDAIHEWLDTIGAENDATDWYAACSLAPSDLAEFDNIEKDMQSNKEI